MRPDSLLPDGYYRPIPIVWFTGAYLAQVAILSFIFLILYRLNDIFLYSISICSTYFIWSRTWKRGMSGASLAWRLSAIIIMSINLAMVCFAIYNRGPF